MEKIENKNLKEEILKTIIWFDLFSHPLTLFEIHKYVSFPCELNVIISELEGLSYKIKSKNGFYFLSGREEIIAERSHRLNYFNKKIKRAKTFSKLISKLPFVYGIAVSNIIGDHNLREESDIDFFIISAPRRIWLARFFCTFLAKTLGLRPNSKTKKNKICLSFYISADALNLEKYLFNENDWYFIYWLAGLEVVYSYKNYFTKFYQENVWLNNYLPNFKFDLSSLNYNDNLNNKKIYFSPILNFCEKIVKKIQFKIIPKKLKEQVGVSSGVILGDTIIKLFLEDRRPLFIKKYEESIRKNN